MQQVAESGGTDAYHAGSILLLKPLFRSCTTVVSCML